MAEVRLSGQLVCRDDRDIAVVVEHLGRHIALTRAELGCVSFCVTPTDDPLVWQVEELFRDAVAFRAHQDRVANSEWGRVTAGIERRYFIDGL
ncbi:antibiotic biosynthesis monooxygenase [Sinomonas sp. JGH33]|uniref:Antibiotic biosynthesis monooxygenase n=1 Tax=Sinomonas terricola TaxID=3110330 RepID=A0ABU5T7V1_9MICC|nr:antibiotic biosynthesis monooxygenase [Sinomonas sp. JGH33]MEA5455760.1 antibiotic biosynthesis monooxygenase [Sinomonas sp. JGH33]